LSKIRGNIINAQIVIIIKDLNKNGGKMIKAIFFDFDETLFSTSGIGSKLLKEVLKETNLKFDHII
jgi:predicted secreted acid phosphatase